jgi:hypothetical protein
MGWRRSLGSRYHTDNQLEDGNRQKTYHRRRVHIVDDNFNPPVPSTLYRDYIRDFDVEPRTRRYSPRDDIGDVGVAPGTRRYSPRDDIGDVAVAPGTRRFSPRDDIGDVDIEAHMPSTFNRDYPRAIPLRQESYTRRRFDAAHKYTQPRDKSYKDSKSEDLERYSRPRQESHKYRRDGDAESHIQPRRETYAYHGVNGSDRDIHSPPPESRYRNRELSEDSDIEEDRRGPILPRRRQHDRFKSKSKFESESHVELERHLRSLEIGDRSRRGKTGTKTLSIYRVSEGQPVTLVRTRILNPEGGSHQTYGDGSYASSNKSSRPVIYKRR